MDLFDLIFDAVDGKRPNEEIIADIQQHFSPADILGFRDEGAEDSEEDLALIYVISLANRGMEGKPLNLDFLAFLLSQGFDVNQPYPGTVMYDQRGYFLDFIKNKPCSLVQLSQLLIKELGYMDERMEADENGEKQGFQKMLSVMQGAAGMEPLAFQPIKDPACFGSTTQAIFGFGYVVTLPSTSVKMLRELCLYAEGETSGALACVPGGDYGDLPEDEDAILEYRSLFLGIRLGSAEADMGGPMPLEIAGGMAKFGGISAEVWDKVAGMIGAEAYEKMMSQPPAYYLTGNGPLTTAMLVEGNTADRPEEGKDFYIGADQEQNQHSIGVSGRLLGSSDQGDMTPIASEALQTSEQLYLIAAYD